MNSIAVPAPHAAAPRSRLVPLAGIILLSAGTAAATIVTIGAGGSHEPDVSSVLRGLVVASYAFVGAYTWWRRPRRRFGLYLVGVGLAYSFVALTASDRSFAHTIGRTAFAAFIVCLAFVFLCYPHDRLSSPLERRLVTWLGLATGVLWVIALPLVEKLPAAGPLADCGGSCPDNAFRVLATPHGLSSAISGAVTAATCLGLLGVAALLLLKARSPALLRQRLVIPLLCCTSVLVVNYAVYTVLREAGVEVTDVLTAIGAVTVLAVPFAMLLGQIRGRVFAATSLGRLVTRLDNEPVTPARLESVLREALGDPQLRLTVWEPVSGRYIDVEGRVAELPVDQPELAVTRVERSGSPVAALVHDAALAETSGVAEGLGATVLLLLDNTELAAELRASRGRIVVSAQEERLRLERNLHDGAQQRLFGMLLKLSAARTHADTEELAQELDELAEDAAAALDELRALAHGIYPTVLRERGLGDALRSFARTASIPVTIVDRTAARFSPVVEEAAYYCALEAIQNAGKHAGPDARVTVTLESRGDDLEFAIVDDGVGFRPSADGPGMGTTSMRDRIGAIGGELEIVSEPTRGTTVRGIARGALR